ncbi:MAG: glycosyltransferase family 87 protein [Myxococcota bacterium]
MPPSGGPLHDAPPSRIPVLGAQAVAFVAVSSACLAYYGGLQGFGATFDPACDQLSCDYIRHFHPTLSAVRGDGLPTAGYLYPPTFAVLAAPAGLLSVPAATALWSALQGLLLAAWSIGPPHLARRVPLPLAVAFTVVTVLSVPALSVLKWGQLSTLLVLLGLPAFALLERDRQGPAGALLALAAALKVFPALWFVWPLVDRRWRSLVWGTAVCAGLLGLLPLVALGPAGTIAFYTKLMAELQAARSWIPTSDGAQYLPTVLVRFLHQPGLRPVFVGFGYVLALGLLSLLLRVRDRTEDRALWAFAIAASLFPLVIESSWLNYFVHLPVVWWVLLSSWGEQGPGPRVGTVLSVGIGVCVATLPWHEVYDGGSTLHYAQEAWLLLADLVGLAGMAAVLIGADDPPRSRDGSPSSPASALEPR